MENKDGGNLPLSDRSNGLDQPDPFDRSNEPAQFSEPGLSNGSSQQAGPGQATERNTLSGKNSSGADMNCFQRGAEQSELTDRLRRFSDFYDQVTGQIGQIFVGQKDLVLGTLIALFSSGHVLIESVPGLGKTLFVRTLGKVLGCRFGRIQFTPDLMPADITGSPVFDMKSQTFVFRPGPVFTQLLLADEINRSPAKTHAALLETMQEKSVTVDGKTYLLDRPFFVLATQNPIESEGTYHLPEAQIDRFMFKLVLDYPSESEESEILLKHGKTEDVNVRLEKLQPVTTPEEIQELSNLINRVYIAPELVDYINKIVRLTRRYPRVSIGASPRAGIALMQGARTLAAFHGRPFVLPDEILQLVLPTLRHRVILTPEAEIEGENADQLLTRLVRSLEIPRT